MIGTMKKTTSHEVTLTLSRIELIHVEAAFDAFTDMKNEDSAKYLGMYQDEFSGDLADDLHRQLIDIREEV